MYKAITVSEYFATQKWVEFVVTETVCTCVCVTVDL